MRERPRGVHCFPQRVPGQAHNDQDEAGLHEPDRYSERGERLGRYRVVRIDVHVSNHSLRSDTTRQLSVSRSVWAVFVELKVTHG